jgi:signal transduction histidine kinase
VQHPPEVQLSDKYLITLGHLASILSHEIRNPLSAVFLHIDLLEEELRQPSAASHSYIEESFSAIRTELNRINDLVQNHLSLARLTHLQYEPVELGKLLDVFALEIRPQLALRGIGLHLQGQDGLGQVWLHQNTFRRVLLNLVQNAIDAMPRGGMLTLRGRCEGALVCLEVGDTGIGISEAQRAQLFRPFHTTKPEGTGLGLYVVQQILAAHGGGIAVTSTPGQGTTCTITMPRMPMRAAASNRQCDDGLDQNPPPYARSN